MKNKLACVALLILFTSLSTAEECQSRADQSCDIVAFTTNKTNASHILTGRICNITTYNDSGGKHVDNVAMTNGSYGPGYHNWTFNYSRNGIYSSTISCQAGTNYGTGSTVITAVNKTLDTKVDEIIPAMQDLNETCKTQPGDDPGWIFSIPSFISLPMPAKNEIGSSQVRNNSMREMWSFERSYSWS